MSYLFPFPLNFIDALIRIDKTLPSEEALKTLKRIYGQDFGYDAQAWLDYALENDPDFVKRLNESYHVESSIEEYKVILLDYERRGEILYIKLTAHRYRLKIKEELSQSLAEALTELINIIDLPMDIIRPYFIKYFELDVDKFSNIEQEMFDNLHQKYRKLKDDKVLDNVQVYKHIYLYVCRRHPMAKQILINACDVTEAEVHSIAQTAVEQLIVEQNEPPEHFK